MSSINPVGPKFPVHKSLPAEKTTGPTPGTPLRASDRLELSGLGGLLAAAKQNDVRTEKVAEIKSQIEAGTYDADGRKLDAAIDKLLDEL